MQKKARIALLLPPVQSLLMPYSAPFYLSAWLKNHYPCETLIIDAGIDWFHYVSEQDSPEGQQFARVGKELQQVANFRDLGVLRQTFIVASNALQTYCQHYAPENVEISGEYTTPLDFQDWKQVQEWMTTEKQLLFDNYIEDQLVEQLREFSPGVIALSVPFDWMIFPALRMIHLLRRKISNTSFILGGHSIIRLWHDRATGFFRLLNGCLVAPSDGEAAFNEFFASVNGEVGQTVSPALVPITADFDFFNACAPFSPAFTKEAVVPDYDAGQLIKYLRPTPVLPVPSSDGCYFGRCRFCSRQRTDQSVRYTEQSGHEVALIIHALAEKCSVNHFILGGDIFSFRFLQEMSHTLKACEAEVSWFCETSFKSTLSLRGTAPFFETLSNSGCSIILNGLESASARVRKLMNYPVDMDKFDTAMHCMEEHDIIPYITMIAGFPGEEETDLWKSVNYIKDHLHQWVFAISRFRMLANIPLGQEIMRANTCKYWKDNLLDGSYNFEDPHFPGKKIESILDKALAGYFGRFSEFWRSIPVLMQMKAVNELAIN